MSLNAYSSCQRDDNMCYRQLSFGNHDDECSQSQSRNSLDIFARDNEVSAVWPRFSAGRKYGFVCLRAVLR